MIHICEFIYNGSKCDVSCTHHSFHDEDEHCKLTCLEHNSKCIISLSEKRKQKLLKINESNLY
jgi:hypothetical protein